MFLVTDFAEKCVLLRQLCVKNFSDFLSFWIPKKGTEQVGDCLKKKRKKNLSLK
jgi:hypothetical protein